MSYNAVDNRVQVYSILISMLPLCQHPPHQYSQVFPIPILTSSPVPLFWFILVQFHVYNSVDFSGFLVHIYLTFIAPKCLGS